MCVDLHYFERINYIRLSIMTIFFSRIHKVFRRFVYAKVHT